MKERALSLIAAGAASLLVATAAVAAEADPVRSTRVGYQDLNLASDAGVAHLYARLRKASQQVCVQAAFHTVDGDCASRALDGAVAAVNNDKLTALHVRASGGSPIVASTG